MKDKTQIRKAYKLTVKGIVDEPWHYDDIIVYADSHGQAKSRGIYEFDSVYVQDYKEYDNQRHIIFTDITARRIKRLDKILYNEKWITQYELEHIHWKSKRDEEARQIWQDNTDGIAVVFAGCYGTYWGANHSGYCSKIEDAGKYTTEEAYRIVKGSSYDRQETVILLNKEKYNNDLTNKIERLLNCRV